MPKDGSDGSPGGKARATAAIAVLVLGAAVALALPLFWTAVVALWGAVVLAAARTVIAARKRSLERRRACEAAVRSLAASVEARDACTGGHIERVAELGLLLARSVAPRDARDPQMAFGFLLHDVGKLATPDSVLHKPGRLDAAEREIMRRHPEEGARIVAGLPFLDRAADVVLYHHERWDGGGYPHRLAGEDIPLWARIFAVVDALDAMTSKRPYGRRLTLDEAIDEIAAGAGTQFDPAVVNALLRLDRAQVETLLEPPSRETAPVPARAPGVLAPRGT